MKKRKETFQEERNLIKTKLFFNFLLWKISSMKKERTSTINYPILIDLMDMLVLVI